MMNSLMLKLRIWIRAETALLKINARQAGQRFTALAMALGLALLAVGLVDLGLLELLTDPHGRIRSAFYVAGGNALLAAIVATSALRRKPAHEEEIVSEIRDMALDEFQTDADEIKAQYEQIADRLRQIESAMSTLTGSGSSLTKLATLGPVLELATHALKSRQKPA